MPNTLTAERRNVRYASLPEVVADAERLAKTGYRTVGQWTYPQILDHLSKSLGASIDGFGFQAPWLVRALIAPFIKNSILTKGMKAGYKLPGASLAPASDLTLPAALDAIRSAVARYESEPQRAPHPFFGMLASQEYTSLHLRHSELHMSFVLPEGS